MISNLTPAELWNVAAGGTASMHGEPAGPPSAAVLASEYEQRAAARREYRRAWGLPDERRDIDPGGVLRLVRRDIAQDASNWAGPVMTGDEVNRVLGNMTAFAKTEVANAQAHVSRGPLAPSDAASWRDQATVPAHGQASVT